MKPRIKDVQLQVREFKGEGFKRCATVCRWNGIGADCRAQDFYTEYYYGITPTSAGRLLRAQEVMLIRGQA